MIKNVICDMGNVLMTWDPHALAGIASGDPADAAIFEKELFTGPEWSLNDRGVYDEAELFAQVAKRFPERLHDRFYWVAENWHNYMRPIPGACEFLEYARGKGLKTFVLSNAPSRFPDCVRDCDFYKLVDGVVFSWHVKLAKPDEAIFRHALDKFGIEASQSLFIDDMEQNVIGARAAGLFGYVFDGDFEKLKRYMADLGV